MLSSFNKENYSMIGNKLEEMSKDYLKRYQKNPKTFLLDTIWNQFHLS